MLPTAINKNKSTKNICLEDSFHSHEKAKYWSPKNKLKPKDITKSSGKKYIFDCECGHEILQSPHKIQINRWCSYCSNPPKKLCSDNECNTCYKKSFASSKRSKYWSDKNDMNPRDIFKMSHKKCWFKCDICNHDFNSSLDNFSGGSGCPYCDNQSLCSDKNCDLCFKKSFASSDKAKYWSTKNDIEPRDIFKSSNKKQFFDCNVCGHEFQSCLKRISSGCWCKYCANLILCLDDTCKICFDKSFASSSKAMYWSNKNKIKPRETFRSSENKYIFDCNLCGHEYEAALKSVTRGNWCLCTKNKTETKLKKWLIDNNFNVIHQAKYDWCKNLKTKKHLPFDFVIESLKIIIELDGPQHFKQVSNWLNPEDTMENDIYKMKQAINNGYIIIRLLQEDVFYNKNDWMQKLKTCINTPNKNSYYFLCTNNEYNDHELLFNTIK